VKISRQPVSGLRAAVAPLAAVLIAGALLLSACNRPAASDRPPERGDVAVAKVGGHTVWKSDVNREAVAQGLISEGEPLDVSSDMFRRVLDEVIDQKLLAAEALKRRLDREPVTQRRLAAARERILGDMLVEGVVDRAVNDNAIQALYQEQLKLAKQSEEIHARQILLANAADAEAARKLLASGASFEALAMERSTDTATRFNGGDMGYFTTDVMPDPYGAALKTAKAGDIVGPFQTEAGWAIVKVEDRRLEKPISLEEARPQIVRFLTYDEVRELLEKLRRQTAVKLLIAKPVDVPGAPTEPASAPAPAQTPAAGATPSVSPALRGAAPPPAAHPAAKAKTPATKSN
jgi:peptidyl-prolyl cis-trans isomerase C